MKRILVIDGQYFFRRTQEKMGYDFNLDFHVTDTVNTLIQRFADTVKQFGDSIDSIIFARDSNSWRKYENIVYTKHIKAYLENKNEIGYKANRKKDDTINWKRAYEAFDLFSTLLEKNTFKSVKVVNINGAEGDDILFVMSKIITKKGDFGILWTSDRDADEMVTNNIVSYKPQRNTFMLSESVYEKINKPKPKSNIFALKTIDNSIETVIKNVISSGFYVTEKVSKNAVFGALQRATMGMDKENIYGCITWAAGSKKMRATQKHIDIVTLRMNLRETLTMDMLFDDIFIERYVRNLYSAVNLKTMIVPATVENIADSIAVFKSNFKLLSLHKKNIPNALLTEIISNVIEYEKMGKINNKMYDYENILYGFSENKQVNENENTSIVDDIFKKGF